MVMNRAAKSVERLAWDEICERYPDTISDKPMLHILLLSLRTGTRRPAFARRT